MHQITNTESIALSPAQKMTIDIAIESLEFLKQVAIATKKPIGSLERTDLEKCVDLPFENRLEDASKDISLRLHIADGIKPNCPNCQSDRTRREGLGKLKKNGERSQRYKCRDCDKTFSIA